MSCNTCHALDKYGTDGRAYSLGDDGKSERRNTPSTYNAPGMIAQFWDGRAVDTEVQALMPLTNPDEMNSTATHVVETLRAIPDYRARFAAAFPDDPKVTIGHVASAIGAFERGLVTPSRWDRFVTGEVNALSAEEIEGLRVFTSVGCLTCHTGEMLGGTSYQMAGVVEPWPNAEDRGRYEITRVAADDMVFRVPGLRNIAKTAPYFHDASASTLSQAIQMMGRHQLGIELTAKEIASIETWMGSLTGDLPTDYIRPPVLASQRSAR
jgi:cytochrome c peroxidase